MKRALNIGVSFGFLMEEISLLEDLLSNENLPDSKRHSLHDAG